MQQEKSKLAADALKQKKIYEELKSKYDGYESKFNLANKEKMLMRLEKDRIIAKVDNLELSMK